MNKNKKMECEKVCNYNLRGHCYYNDWAVNGNINQQTTCSSPVKEYYEWDSKQKEGAM